MAGSGVRLVGACSERAAGIAKRKVLPYEEEVSWRAGELKVWTNISRITLDLDVALKLRNQPEMRANRR